VIALAAICLFVVFGLTMAINVPINNTLMTWNASAPPGDAIEIWKRWEQASEHCSRDHLADRLRSAGAGIDFGLTNR